MELPASRRAPARAAGLACPQRPQPSRFNPRVAWGGGSWHKMRLMAHGGPKLSLGFIKPQSCAICSGRGQRRLDSACPATKYESQPPQTKLATFVRHRLRARFRINRSPPRLRAIRLAGSPPGRPTQRSRPIVEALRPSNKPIAQGSPAQMLRQKFTPRFLTG